MPKVSVLIPVFNTFENHLQLAIESILNQSFKDFELIIVNDGSTEPRVERVVKSFDDDRIRYYCNEKNLGISKTRNYLLDLAQGEYLAIMDHDDISVLDRLEKQVNFLDTHPQYGVVSGRQKYMHSGKVAAYPVDDKYIKMSLMEFCPLMHSCAMLRKSVLDEYQIRYEEEFTPAEDYALWCRMIPYTKFHNFSDILMHYRDHADNTSHRQAALMLESAARIKAIMKVTHPILVEENHRLIVKYRCVRLFRCITLFMIIRTDSCISVKLFNKITILTIHKHCNL